MEFKKLSPGYPCSEYIIKRISTTEELWLYAKAFVKTAYEREVPYPEIITRLTASLSTMSADTGVSCPDFSEFGSTCEEQCQYIMTNPTVASIKSCTTLYKKTDSHTGACRLCSYSTLYRNANEENEYAVFKFMLQNEKNLNFVADYIDENFFSSCMDVSIGIPVEKAHVLPMLKILAQSLLKNSLRLMVFSPVKTSFFIAEEPFDIIWEDAYRTFPRNRKIPVSLSNNPMWQNALKSSIKERIANAKDLNTGNIKDIFNDYALSSSNSHSSDRKKSSDENSILRQLTLENIIVSLDHSSEPPSSTGKDKMTKKEKHTPRESATSTQHGLSVLPPMAEEMAAIPKPTTRTAVLERPVEEIPAEDVLTEDILVEETFRKDALEEYITDSVTTMEEHSIAIEELAQTMQALDEEMQRLEQNLPSLDEEMEAENTETINKRPLQEETKTSLETVSEGETGTTEPPTKPSSVISSPDTVLQEEDILLLNDRNLIQLPILPDYIRKELVLHIRKNKSLPAPFYQGVLRTKELSIEVVKSTNGSFLFLMWSYHMKKFITIALEDCNEEMKKLLSYKSIKKICHTPYVLYGIGKLYGLPVKNVFSIQTVHGRLFPTADTLAYKDLCCTLQTTTEYGEYVKKSMAEDCSFLGGMPIYHELHDILIHMVHAHNGYSLFQKDAWLDEALGSSYFFGLNFADKGTLLLLLGNHKFYFNKDFYRKKINEGRYYGYFVKEDIDAIALFQHLLQRLAEKGIFRTTNLQVLGMDRQQLLLFIEKEQEEYLSGIIEMLAFEYGRTYLSHPITLHNFIHEI